MKRLLLATLVVLSGACSFFEDPETVEIKRLGEPCSFLNLAAGVCLDSVYGDDGSTCLPPSGYELNEVSCDGLDNDCDGVADTGCPCSFGDVAIGVCADGRITNDGRCGAPNSFGSVDICGDELDNNCDGSIDEGCTCDFNMVDTCESAVSGDGTCAQPGSYEAIEQSCDGIDNDCDGTVDENLMTDCSKTEGSCAGAQATCSNGVFATCADAEYSVRSSYESDEVTCDAKDNDCDGAIDENCPCNFRDLATGVCLSLVRDETGTCPQPNDFNETEQCDGVDNNCNGAVDEGCNCQSGTSILCGSDTGECEVGNQTCVNNVWSNCQGGAGPSVEQCNGLDDNCDGTIDELLIGVCGNQLGVCANSIGGCVNGFFAACGVTQYSANSVNYESAEVSCDGIDNDCDGVTDEGCSCGFNNSAVGVCGTAVVSAIDGDCGQPLGYEVTESMCDGADNDCDGSIDEGCPCDFLGTSVGVCSNGVVDGGGNCLAPAQYSPVDDNCDALDNDCDGVVDDDAPDTESFCGDGRDNDCDRLIDCRDPDCANQICIDDVQIFQELGLARSGLNKIIFKVCGQDGTCK